MRWVEPMTEFDELKKVMSPYVDSGVDGFNACIIAHIQQHLGESIDSAQLPDEGHVVNYIQKVVGKKPTHETMVDFLVTALTLCNINDNLHIYEWSEGVFVDAEVGYRLRKIIVRVLGVFDTPWSHNFEQETVRLLKRKVAQYKDTDVNKQVVVFRDQALDLKSLKLVPFDPKYLSTRKSDVSPKQGSTPNFDRFLKTTFNDDQDKIKFVWYWLAVQLQVDRAVNKLVFMYSSGASGKSTLIHVITRLLGSSNVSHNSLNHFNGEFGKENMIGRFAWILEESGDNISDFAGIKNIVEGNEMSVNRKNKIMVQTIFTLKVTLSFNKLPIPENTIGFSRRVVLLNFPNTFVGKGADKDLNGKLESEKDQIAFRAIEYLRELKSKYNYDLSQVITGSLQRETDEYFDKARGPVYMFLRQKCQRKNGSRTPKTEILNAFLDFLDETDEDSKGFNKPKSFWPEFKKQFRNLYGRDCSFSKSSIEYVNDLILSKEVKKI